MKRAGPGVRETKSRRQPPSASGEPRAGPKPAAPLKPRRGLFAGLMLVFAVWVAVLLGMYVVTVYPARHPSPATTAPSAN